MIKAYKNFWASYNNEVYSVYRKWKSKHKLGLAILYVSAITIPWIVYYAIDKATDWYYSRDNKEMSEEESQQGLFLFREKNMDYSEKEVKCMNYIFAGLLIGFALLLICGGNNNK